MNTLHPFRITSVGLLGTRTWFVFAASMKEARQHARSQFGMNDLVVVKQVQPV